ncbi:MAG: replicative DNA helicase [bacterium]|nr:replicative DNA helicase [bacterium]
MSEGNLKIWPMNGGSDFSPIDGTGPGSPNRFGEQQFAAAGQIGRVPPNSLEAEISVIGAVLLDNDVVNIVMELLQESDFYQRSNQMVFAAILSLVEHSKPIDVVTLAEELRMRGELDAVGGVDYLGQLVHAVPTSANAEFYARAVKDMSLRRRVIHEASQIVDDAFNCNSSADNFIDEVEQRIFQVSESRSKKGFSRVSDIVKESIKEVERRYISNEPLTGISTGFIDLDEMTSGLQPSDLIIVAGRPSMGKTALALSIAKHVGLESGKGVAVFSLEMPKNQIVTRLLCADARVSNSRVRSGKLGETDFPALVDSASRIAQASIFVDDTPAISVIEMRAKVRRLHRENPLSLVMVDYLQLMRGNTGRRNDSREQEISAISGALKALAKEINVPVIALSQLNRSLENRNDKRPIMADLRESGAIEQDADIIGFVYRDEVYNPDTTDKGVAEFIISKHRNGPVGTVRMAFQGEFTLFENLAEDEDYDYLGENMSFSDEIDDEL